MMQEYNTLYRTTRPDPNKLDKQLHTCKAQNTRKITGNG